MVTLGQDKYYTRYYIRVWAKNQMGEGPKPEPVVAYSAVSVPKVTPQQTIVQPYNATALQVFWDPIADKKENTGGELLGFHVSLELSASDNHNLLPIQSSVFVFWNCLPSVMLIIILYTD